MRSATPLAVLLALAVPSSATADTIVLKNGHKIAATNITQDAEHVTYQTPAGQLTIPKSIVARIDRDDFTYSSAANADSEPPVSAPKIEPVRGYEDVAHLAVHDDAVDYPYLATLETNARSGAAIAIAKLAAGHYAAAQFLAAKGDTDSAIDQYHQALVFAPDNIGLLLNLAVLYLRESQIQIRARSARTCAPGGARFGGRREAHGLGILRRQ